MPGPNPNPLDLFQKVIVSLFTLTVAAMFAFGVRVTEELAVLAEQDRQVPQLITEASLRQELRDTKLRVEVERIQSSLSALAEMAAQLRRNDDDQWPRLRAHQTSLELLRGKLLVVCREVHKELASRLDGGIDCVLDLPKPQFR